jgi:hypothetical protein
MCGDYYATKGAVKNKGFLIPFAELAPQKRFSHYESPTFRGKWVTYNL